MGTSTQIIPGTMRSYIVKENHIVLVVNKFLRYRQTHTQIDPVTLIFYIIYKLEKKEYFIQRKTIMYLS